MSQRQPAVVTVGQLSVRITEAAERDYGMIKVGLRGRALREDLQRLASEHGHLERGGCPAWPTHVGCSAIVVAWLFISEDLALPVAPAAGAAGGLAAVGCAARGRLSAEEAWTRRRTRRARRARPGSGRPPAPREPFDKHAALLEASA
jgi:hypothetical protein